MSAERTFNPKKQKIQLERALEKSEAWHDLKAANSIRVLIRFLSKCQWSRISKKHDYYIRNNGEIEFTYGEANKMGMANSTFTRCLDELIAHGFIDIAKSGAGVHKLKTLYSISERWKKWGTDEFKENPRPTRPKQYKNIGFQPGHKHHPSSKKGDEK